MNLRENCTIKLLLILLLSLSACSRPAIKDVAIDSPFQPYVDQFVAEGKNQGKYIYIDDLEVRFTNELPDTTLGQCTLSSNNPPIIHVNENTWYIMSNIRREVTMLHELSHCCLKRGHINTWTNGIYTSIMFYEISYDEDMYRNNWQYYMKELFYDL